MAWNYNAQTAFGKRIYMYGKKMPKAIPLNNQTPDGTELTSGIVPRPVFSAADTSKAFHNIMAGGRRTAASAGQGLALPGISTASPALQSRAAVGAANAIGAATQQGTQSKLADAITNAHALLQGQIARAGDFAGQIGLRNQLADMNTNYGAQSANARLGDLDSQLQFALAQAANRLGLQSTNATDFANQLRTNLMFTQTDQQYQQQMMDSLLGALLWA